MYIYIYRVAKVGMDSDQRYEMNSALTAAVYSRP